VSAGTVRRPGWRISVPPWIPESRISLVSDIDIS
jgi:hypothetical protein